MNDQPTPGRRPDGFNDEDICKPFQWVATPPGEPERADACTWTQGVCFSFRNIPCGDGFYFTPSHTRYDTACGSSFRFSEEGNDKFQFCPYCGGKISLASESEPVSEGEDGE